jgi:formyltetrahydrofolate-dependent phosphoribosylglycinamide formyltransferase
VSKTRLAVLLSGSGRTLQNIIEHIQSGKLDAEIVLVISSKKGAYGLKRAQMHGLPTVTVPRKGFANDEEFSKAITSQLDRVQPELILMAGFLHFYRIPAHYLGKVMNIHPALLPGYGGKGFYGLKVHQSVLMSGVKESGCTVHFADNIYDHGPIILQRRVPVYPEDTPETLAERVFKEECIAYPEAIRLFQQGKLKPGLNP